MSQTTEKRSRFAHLGGWVAELILVFVGVSAAFWLSNYQQHWQDEEREAAEFKRALDAGEMPPLRPFVFTTDYSPGDFATWLQSGGTQLLDLETLMALRNDESVIRWGLSGIARY